MSAPEKAVRCYVHDTEEVDRLLMKGRRVLLTQVSKQQPPDCDLPDCDSVAHVVISDAGGQ